jgi:hypothetical protein
MGVFHVQIIFGTKFSIDLMFNFLFYWACSFHIVEEIVHTVEVSANPMGVLSVSTPLFPLVALLTQFRVQPRRPIFELHIWKIFLRDYRSDTILQSIPWTTFILFWSFNNFFRRKWRAARFPTICALNWVPNEIFDEVMDIWKISSLYGDGTINQICHDKTTFRLKNDPINKFLNLGNVLIVFSWSSSTHRHTSTRSCYDIYRRLWELSVPTFRIFEDFRGFW